MEKTLREYRSSKRVQRYLGISLIGTGVAHAALINPAWEYIGTSIAMTLGGAFFFWHGSRGKYLHKP